MNDFAKQLLSLLFSWMRSLAEGVLSAFSSGKMRNTVSWLGKNWLWLILLLCLACTVMDYFIWLIRWKPYIIWSNKLRRLFGRREKPIEEPEYIRFQQGYDQGVDMDFSDIAPAPRPMANDMDFDARQQPPYEPAQEEYFPAQPQPVYPLYAQQPDTAAAPPEQLPFVPDQLPARNRRSQRHEKKRFRLGSILPSGNDDAETLLDGLPPAVDKYDAFHAPVYPNQYNNQQG